MIRMRLAKVNWLGELIGVNKHIVLWQSEFSLRTLHISIFSKNDSLLSAVNSVFSVEYCLLKLLNEATLYAVNKTKIIENFYLFD